jgi:membrane protein DedA with SNARE-associated domain
MRRGVWFVLFYHFAGYTRVIGPTAAGLLRMPFHRWAMADYGGAVLWIFGYFSAGYLLGVLGLSLDATDRWFRIVEWGLLVLMVIWLNMMLKTHTDLFGERKGSSAEDDADDEGLEDDEAAQEAEEAEASW